MDTFPQILKTIKGGEDMDADSSNGAAKVPIYKTHMYGVVDSLILSL